MCKNIIDTYISCKNTKSTSNEECSKLFQDLKHCINKYS